MSDEFLEELMEHMTAAIDQPGTHCAREAFTISKPDDMSNQDWDAWCDQIRLEWHDPELRAAAAAKFSSGSSA